MKTLENKAAYYRERSEKIANGTWVFFKDRPKKWTKEYKRKYHREYMRKYRESSEVKLKDKVRRQTNQKDYDKAYYDKTKELQCIKAKAKRCGVDWRDLLTDEQAKRWLK